MSNTSTAQPDAEDTTSIHVTGDSPDRIDVPIWVLAQTKLAPPLGRTGKPRPVSAVLDVVMFLLGARFGASPDDTVRVDRAAIARWVGARPDTLKWVFEYLELIGFLTVHRGVRDKVHGGRTPDRFQISLSPPNGYRGPRTFVELNLELTAVSPGQDHNHPGMGKVRDLTHSGVGKGAVSPGQDHNHPGMGLPRVRSDQNLIFSFGGGGEDQMERASAGAPEAPASPAGTDEHDEAARQLVACAPWSDVANRQGQDISASTADLDRLHSAIATALREGRVDVAMAADVLTAALAKAKNSPVAYAAGAFEPKQLGQWVRSLTTITLASPTPVASEHVQAKSTPRSAPSLALPACSTCGANEGEGLAVRQYDGEDGRAYPCPCRTATAA